MRLADNETLRILAGRFTAQQYQGTANTPFLGLSQLREDLVVQGIALPTVANLEGNDPRQKARSLIDSYAQGGYAFSTLLQQFAGDFSTQLAQSSDLLFESFNFASDLLSEGKEDSARETEAILAVFDDLLNSWDTVCQTLDRKFRILVKNNQWEQATILVERIRRVPRTPKRQCLPVFVLPQELYQQGNAAEESGHWDEAERAYEELERTYPTYSSDTTQRLGDLRQYKQGWSFASGDQPNYERAATILQSLQDSATKVLQRRLLNDLKQSAEELQKKGDWDRSYALLQSLQQAMPAPHVLDGQIERAQRPGGYYAQAEQLIEARRWDDADAKFSEIDEQYPAYRDTRQWLENLRTWEMWYSEAVRAWDEGEWDESLKNLGELVQQQPAYKDAYDRLEALQQCQKALRTAISYLDDKLRLVNTNGWREAEESLALCQRLIPHYSDAAVALQYLHSLRAIHERRWEDADCLLAEIEDAWAGYRDVRMLRTGLQLREVLATQAAHGYLEPALDWPGGYPYQVLRSAGLAISPKASLADVRDASWSLQQAGMTPIQRQAWDDLRNLDRRLFVDAFLLPLEKTLEMRAFVEDYLADRLSAPAADALNRRFPDQSAFLNALRKDFASAFGDSLKTQRQNPASTELARRAALLSLSWAEGLDRDKQREEADLAWQRVIGEWAIWLTDQRYWQSWATTQARYYGQAVLAAHIDELLTQLEEELARRLGEADERRRARQPIDPTSSYSLVWNWRAELAAVRWLRRLDGAPTQAHGRVACGPRLLEPLGLWQALGDYAARLAEQPSSIASQLAGAPSEEDARRLRLYFSSLAQAAVLLESAQPQPTQALSVLAHANCGSCPPCWDSFCPLHAGAAPDLRVCCGKCPNFERRNPAYARLTRDRGGWLYEDAQRLALQAKMSLAQEIMIREQEWDQAAVRRNWAEALRLAEELGDRDFVAEQVRTAALGRATVLGRDPALHPDSTRLDHAAALLEMAASLVRATPQMQLRLGDVLTDRASYYLKRDAHQRAVEDFERAFTIVGDLERAGVHVPYRHRTQDLYATALTWCAMELREDRERALSMLDMAQGLAEKGLAKSPDYDEYRKTLELIANARATLENRLPPWLADDAVTVLDRVLGGAQPGTGDQEAVTRLRTEASEQRQHGDLAASLESLGLAWALAPDDQGIQEDLIEIATQYAGQLLASGSVTEARALVDGWADRLIGSPWITDRLDYLRWAPTIQHLLRQTDLKWRDTGRAMQFPFDSPALGTITLRLFIQGNATLIAAPLPPMSEADEAAIYGNVLQNTGDITLVRLSHLDPIGPVLASYVPIRLLDSAWLEFLLRGLARYADMQPSFLRNPAQLRVHLRSQRDILRLIQPDRGRAQRTLLNLPQLCQAQPGWSCLETESGQWRLESPSGAISAEAGDDGIRLAQELGAVSYTTSPRATAVKNSQLNLGKLSFDDRGLIWLACEAPYLDLEGFLAMAGCFAEHGPIIRQEFCAR